MGQFHMVQQIISGWQIRVFLGYLTITSVPLKYDMRQGSASSLMLFVVYMLLGNIIQSHGLSFHSYAAVYLSSSSVEDLSAAIYSWPAKLHWNGCILVG